MLSAFLWGGLAAASLLIGFALAGRGLSNRTIGLVMGVGAGALISAIAYELVPEDAVMGLRTAAALAAGALAFFVGDWLVDRRGGADRKAIAGESSGSGPAIFIGTLLDNVPESIILGMSLALGGAIDAAFLAAVFVSNLPEGMAGSINLRASGVTSRRVFWLWVALVLISAASAALGYALVVALPAVNGRIAQAFAAGAMLATAARRGRRHDAGSLRARRQARGPVHRLWVHCRDHAIVHGVDPIETSDMLCQIRDSR